MSAPTALARPPQLMEEQLRDTLSLCSAALLRLQAENSALKARLQRFEAALISLGVDPADIKDLP